MKNVKISMAPPYTAVEGVLSKVELTADFASADQALNFLRDLNQLVIHFTENQPGRPNVFELLKDGN